MFADSESIKVCANKAGMVKVVSLEIVALRFWLRVPVAAPIKANEMQISLLVTIKWSGGGLVIKNPTLLIYYAVMYRVCILFI